MTTKQSLIRKIFITFQKEGIHQYPGAPDGVEFLRYPHRHIFHFRIEIAVGHNEREIEFILFKRRIEELYGNGTLQLNHKSCETIAEELIEVIDSWYPGREISVQVSEDLENGAVLIQKNYTPNKI